MNSFETFKQLHLGSTPFLLGNIWDVNSARIFEANHYKAIGISSQALSNSFGYEDGENLPFATLLQVAKRVVELVKIPFTVDIESGFSPTTEGIIENISKLQDIGVAGINIEDTLPGITRQFQVSGKFEKNLSAISDHISRNNLQIFINVRTDGFLLGMPAALEETLNRIKVYESAGADGIFVPCITKSSDIQAVTAATTLPVNVMCMPDLPGFAELGSLGVKRISMGPFLFSKVYEYAAKLANTVKNDQNCSSLFA
ncbi:MAG: 2-Methylisocitrate lyase, mutase family [Mucilaginibacter sp.]|nr:2-Methylisocitrate lyase, mutase family [Mucilaginibacter sp.]